MITKLCPSEVIDGRVLPKYAKEPIVLKLSFMFFIRPHLLLRNGGKVYLSHYRFQNFQ